VPAPAAAEITQDPFGGLEAAAKLRLGPLADTVEAALMHGMDVVMLACGGLALLWAVLAVVFMPNRAPGADEGRVAEPQRERPESAYGHTA
jgi:MFS transporter, DHA2 family, multidrug resistance protein